MPRQYNRISSDDYREKDEIPASNSLHLRSPISTSASCSASVVSTTSSIANHRANGTANNSSSSGTNGTTNHASNKSIGHRISDKIHALIWIAMALFTGKQSRTAHMILSSEIPIRPLLHISITQITINTILMMYLGIYLPKIKGLKDPEAWSVYCPRIIPFMTANGLVCAFTLTRSLWPAWGFLTPFILGIECIGLLFATQFIPWL